MIANGICDFARHPCVKFEDHIEKCHNKKNPSVELMSEVDKYLVLGT